MDVPSTHANNRKRGITLLLAIIVTTIVISVTLNLTTIAVGELSLTRIARDSTSARYAAESALECAIYWLFQGEEYFSDTVAEDISCGDKTISVGGSDTSIITINDGLHQYGEVTVIKTDPDKRSYNVVAEGFNSDPIIIPESALVEQKLEAITNEVCTFDPEYVDSGGIVGGTIAISSTNLQNTLNAAYGSFGTNHIEASTDNTGYQTWSIGNFSGNVVVNLQVTPLESDAAHINTFGFYINNTSDPYTSWAEINAASAFNPVFANKSNTWGAPLLAENINFTNPWQSFSVSAHSGDVIAFGIHSVGATTWFRSTERSVNGSGGGTGANLKIHGMCITPTGGVTDNGTRITLEACDNSAAQEWYQNGFQWINVANTGRAIDLWVAAKRLLLYNRGNGNNQKWTTSLIAPDVYQFETQESTLPGYCIQPEDYAGGNNELIVAICDPSDLDQQVTIESTGNYYGADQFVLSFDVNDPIVDDDIPEFVLAFEDLTVSGGSGTDYDDMVVAVRVVSCSTSVNRK